MLPRIQESSSPIPPSQAAPFLLGMYAAWRHLRVREALQACRILLQALPEKARLSASLALPLHLLSRVHSMPGPLRAKASFLSRSILSSLPSPERLWTPGPALVPLPGEKH